MKTMRFAVRGSLLALASGLLAVHAARAQGGALQGQVVGPDGPVSGLAVALHRVTPEGGANIDEATTDDEGRFTFTVDITPADSAVYFAAVRMDDQLYVGTPIREVPTGPYVIQVGPGAASVPMGGAGPLNGATGAAPQRDGSNTGTLAVFLLIGLGILGVVVYAMRHTLGGGPDRRRELLVELAELEEALADGALGDEERDAHTERRALLRGRLLGSRG
jgi:hypothetical protein